YFYSVSATNVAGTSAPSTQDSGFASTSSSAGSLSASATASSAAVNLTTAGTSDWAKWPNYVHKASGGAQISTYAVVGVGAVQNYVDDPRTISFGDGTPTASGSDRSGIYISGTGIGFQVKAPADTTARTLTVYVGGWASGGKLVAHLSDGSAPDYV